MTALRFRDSTADVLRSTRHPNLGNDSDPSAISPFTQRFPALY